MPIALLLALLASLGVHVALLFGPELALPGIGEIPPEMPPLRAELRPPPVPLAAPVVPEPKRPRPPQVHPAKAKAHAARHGAGHSAHAGRPHPPVLALTAPSAEATVPAEAAGAAAPDTGEGTGAGASSGQENAASPTPTPAPEAATISLPDQVRIRYAVFRGELGFELGRTLLNWDSWIDPPQPDGSPGQRRYRATMLTETVGLAGLLKPIQMTQESQGDVMSTGLRPRHFFTGRDGKRQDWADFDWGGDPQTGAPDGDTAHVKYAKGEATVARGTQDFLSLFFQFAWLPGFPDMPSYPLTVATGKKISDQLVVAEGVETVTIPTGTFRTLHVKSVDREPIELWLALDLYALPIKVRYVDRYGDRYDQYAVELTSSAGDALKAPPPPPALP